MKCRFVLHNKKPESVVAVYICTRCGEKAVCPVERLGSLKRPCTAAPTLLEKAANLGKALGRWVLSGFAVVSRKEFQRRGEICQTCPIYDHANEACGKCGCTVGGKERLIDKRRMKSEKCPDGKW